MPQFVQSTSDSLLIPGLPNDVASRILSTIPYAYHARLKQTCKSWHQFLSSQTLISLRKHFGHVSNLICLFPQDPSVTSPILLDADSLAWRPLPPMPCNPYAYGRCNFGTAFLSPHLYVLGGSVFDARSFPLDRPTPSSDAFRFDFVRGMWDTIAPMMSPRGSFACAAVAGGLVAAGGGSRHMVFEAAGTRMRAAERYDVARDEWEALEELPEHRAGCIGFVVEEKGEFWVVGGYGHSRTLAGLFPVDVYCKDAVVLDLAKRTWRDVGDMWGRHDRVRIGRIAVVGNEALPAVFMLDHSEILRYDMASNCWLSETRVPRKVPNNAAAYSFIAMGEELHVMTLVKPYDPMDNWRLRPVKRVKTLHIQIYHPRKKMWRSVQTKPPFTYGLNFRAAVMCTVQL